MNRKREWMAGETYGDYIARMQEEHIQAKIREAIAKQREADAKKAEAIGEEYDNPIAREIANAIAQAIREGGNQ